MVEERAGTGQSRWRAPGTAALLSGFLPGLGQLWLGARRRGLLIALPLLADIGALRNGRYPGLLNSLYVYAVQHPTQFPGGDAAGFRAVSGAIQELIGQPLDGAIVVNLNGFVDLVKAVGGLWIDVPYSLYDDHYPKPDGTGYITISFKPGCQHLDGIHALEYARSRHQDSDYGRIRRQQRVLISLARELDPLALLPQVPKLLDIAQDNLWTTIDQNEIANLAVLAARVDTRAIQAISFAPPTYPGYLSTSEIERIQKAVATVFDAPAVEPSATPDVTPKPCPKS